MMKAVIFSGGIYKDPALEPNFCREFIDGAGLIVAADGGGSALLSLGVPTDIPTILIGDMDSIAEADLEGLKNSEGGAGGVEIIQESPDKDFTDTELALDIAHKRGADEIVILGALGGRVDHALANLSLLIKAKELGIQAKIIDEDQEVTLLDVGIKNRIEGGVGNTVSLMSLLGDAEGIITNDLKYPLIDDGLSLLSPLGVSNVISGPDPWVIFTKGLLLLVRVKNP